jgi:hypothetical protein
MAVAITTTAATASGIQSRFFIDIAMKQNTPPQEMTGPQWQRTGKGSARLGDHPAYAS